MTKKIGVLGSGEVAKQLANGFLQHGSEVLIGSRDVSKLAAWQSKTDGKAHVGSFEGAAKFGEIIVLAVKGTAALSLVKQLSNHLGGKTVIDATNPIADAPPQNGVLKFFTTLDDSLMERMQQAVPAANFVKAFNTVGNTLMVHPKFSGGKPTMFICGNNESAKKEVIEILDQFGWENADMGRVEAARAIEPLCILWCIPGFLQNQWSHAFKLLKT